MKLDSQEFNYTLPRKNIALRPTCQREYSKLLLFHKKNISHHCFSDIPNMLPPRSTLFFNNTKVIPARLFFHKPTGGLIEVMLLNPATTDQPIHQTMQTVDPIVWQCTIRNIKRWKENTTLNLNQGLLLLEAKLIDKDAGYVEFSWQPNTATFAEVITLMGHTPLPPYLGKIHNEAPQHDARYQTVYCRHEGGVAAPTAGLHFSDALIKSLSKKGILAEFITLHVGGGTFQPIKTDNVFDHDMHAEQLMVSKKALDALLMPDKVVVAVGTTSARVLESLYWLGAGLLKGGLSVQNFFIKKSTPYEHSSSPLPSAKEALGAVRAAFPQSGKLIGKTAIFIAPGYKFRICKGLITNFHLPDSTLIPLVAAFVGKDWKIIYQTALQHNYRFLSYGDSSLLLP